MGFIQPALCGSQVYVCLLASAHKNEQNILRQKACFDTDGLCPTPRCAMALVWSLWLYGIVTTVSSK